MLGNQNAITYKEIFPLIKSNRLWLGYKSGDMSFRVPADSEPRKTRFWIDESGQKWRSMGNICWFTNLDIRKRHEELLLWRKYRPEDYPKYDNYDAINVDKVADIPVDYDGVMGVPITFLDKYNPDQFEIVEFRKGSDGKATEVELQVMTQGEADGAGRRKSVPVEGQTETIPAGTVVAAIGQRVDWGDMLAGSRVQLRRSGAAMAAAPPGRPCGRWTWNLSGAVCPMNPPVPSAGPPRRSPPTFAATLP